jgi:hypothetical protein
MFCFCLPETKLKGKPMSYFLVMLKGQQGGKLGNICV